MRKEREIVESFDIRGKLGNLKSRKRSCILKGRKLLRMRLK